MRALFYIVMAMISSAVIANDVSHRTVQGDAVAGKIKSASCSACHGVDGNSTIPTNPNLAVLGSQYIAKQLDAFKTNKRQNAIMQSMVTTLNEQDMLDLAAYYGNQDPMVGEADPELVEWGEQLYRGGRASSGIPACIGCHGPGGKGIPASAYPGISGQHAQYTITQLQAFRSEQRKNLQMNAIAQTMSDKDIKALGSYIQGLH